MPVLAVTTPLPYEASAGAVAGRLPAGATALELRAGGRLVRRVELRRGQRRFRLAPHGLPRGDLTLEVRALRGRRTLALRFVPHLTGLPRSAGQAARPRRTDGRAQRLLAGSRSQPGATGAVWLCDLASGRSASWNAGARLPAASTLKLAILLTVLGAQPGEPTAAATWPLARRLVLDSSNRAANALLAGLGGSTAAGGARVNALMARLGATGTDMYGGYLLEPGERRLAGGGPPARADEQPALPRGKTTTAHDLGIALAALHGASVGRGPLLALGVSPREARVALWLLVHARYAGLVAPSARGPVAHKAGWLPALQHDAALVYGPAGPLVAVVMSYRPAGASYAASRAYAARVLRIAAALAPARRAAGVPARPA